MTAGEEKSLPIRFSIAVVDAEINPGQGWPSPQVVAGVHGELNAIIIAFIIAVAASTVHKEFGNEESDGRSAHTREQPVHVFTQPAAGWNWGPAGWRQRVAAEGATRAGADILA